MDILQEYHQMSLILNFSMHPNTGMPCVNGTMERDAATSPLSPTSPSLCILQVIWELYLDQGLVTLYKLDVTDAYHWITLFPYQVGEFAYTILLVIKVIL